MRIKDYLIKFNSLQILEGASSWEEAIQIAATPLEDSGVIERSYTEAMINITKEKGPYYILGDNIAMPHSKPSNGAIQTGVSLLLLKKAVAFDVNGFDKRYADIIFVLVAKEKGEDVQNVVAELLNIVENSEKVKKLRSSTKKKEILDLFDEN